MVRSYFSRVRITWLFGNFANDENLFIMNAGPLFPTTDWRVILNPLWWNWSSNTYTMDHIVCESYYYRLLTGVKDPAPCFIYLLYNPVDGQPGLQLYNPDGPQVFFGDFTLPGPPGGYWLPGV